MKRMLALGVVAAVLAAGCPAGENRSVGVFVLLTIGDNQMGERETGREAIEYLLQALAPADTLAAASMSTVSFSDTDIIASVNFDQRPSVVNTQKRSFRDRFVRFVQNRSDSPYSDVTGGLLQAVETLNRSGPDRKIILIVSNLQRKPTVGDARDLPIQMTGFDVVILKPVGLQPDSRSMKSYLRRAGDLRKKVEYGSGRCTVIDDVKLLESILTKGLQAEQA